MSIGLQQAKQGGDDVPPLHGHPGLSDASEGTGVPESRGEVGVQDPEHHDGARDTRWRDDRMTGRRSHGRLSALNGVVHQGTLLHESELAHTDPDPQFFHRAMRYDIGLPSPVI